MITEKYREIREAKFEVQRRQHYFAVKKLSALFRGTSKHHGDFYCLNNLHIFAREKKLE